MSGTNITFTQIPSNLLISGTYVEIDPKGGNSDQPYRTLIIGQILASGVATPNVPKISAGLADAVVQGGQGSMLALMTARYLQADSFGELWYLPLSDDPASVAATGTFSVAGSPVAAGVISLYLAGVLVPTNVSAGQTATAIAAAIAANINANVTLPVVAALNANAGQVVLTAKNKGLAGNDIDARLNYYGSQNSEVTPAGLTFTGILSGTGTQLSAGAQNPTALAAALANLSDLTFDFVVFPYTDAASLNAWQLFMNATSGRWCWEQMLYGGAFAAYRGTYGQCTAFGLTRNDPAIDITAVYDVPEPAWIWAARLAGDCAVSLRANPAVPLQDLVSDLLPPPVSNRFTPGERNALLQDGLSTWTVNTAGQVVTDRHVTTYQTNAAGLPDTSYQDVESRYTLSYVCRDLRAYLTGLYSRKIFVDNNTQLSGAVNNAVVMPSMIKASAINRYNFLAGLGLVQDADAFAKGVQVQKVGSMARVFWPGNLSNQLRQIGIAISFQKT